MLRILQGNYHLPWAFKIDLTPLSATNNMNWFPGVSMPFLRQSDAAHAPPAHAAVRAAPPDAEATMVFGMRVLLSLSTLLTLFTGAGSTMLGSRWSGLIFVAYALHSITLLCVARTRAGFWHGPVIYWVDIGWYGLMVWASGGTPSPFFALFFFPILTASFRHGFDTGARLTLGATAVLGAAVLVSRSSVVLHLLLLRTTFVLALGYMIAFWGGLAVDQRRRLALLRDVSRLSNPRFGVQHTLDSLMEKILRFYGGASCVLLMQDSQGEWMLNTVHHPASGRPISRNVASAIAAQPLLALGSGATVLYRGGALWNFPANGPATGVAAGSSTWSEIDPAACACIADLLDTTWFISAPLPLLKGAGHIFVTSGERLRRSDATFLNHIVQQAFPVIETIDLLDRLASAAAFRERQSIARDLHDSTIQPYIGLRHAIAAIRKQAGDDNIVAADLDRLMDMSADVVKDMRDFAQRFKNGRQEEPELLIALRRQLAQVRSFYDVNVTLDAAGGLQIHDRMAAEVFQIVTEGVSNICKHTRARTASVWLADAGGELCIDIANAAEGNATPFTPKSIAERVRALGGTLIIDTDALDTRLRIRLPS
jgi:signal transduction histidine kinase